MWWKTGIVLITIVSSWASAEFVKPDFIENVVKEVSAGESRIVSGWEATPGQHPHHAALRMVYPQGLVSACGGSIVHRNWMITAAHCTAGTITLVVRAGVVDLTKPEYIFETTEWYNHPTYNDLAPSVVQPNDISIVRLQRPVVYSDNLRAIRIQPASEAYNDYMGQILYASGHGRTWTGGSSPEVLNWVYLRGVSNPSCATVFGSIITSTTICAQFFNVTSQSICQGDSGGPLVTWDADGDPILVGVSSFVAGGTWGCHSGLPGGNLFLPLLHI
ncbi:unnamed protein product [Parnassius apollo]|uniref:(apollo) hypothetical protein n=1 Tax=Parnassius apollo TaxID=110799 RepID=A0A8S3Y5F1_PARAO|nr:unnamed protein product [Parnassius apollo]